MAIMVTDTDGARLRQGQHPDPHTARQPDPATWPARRRLAFASAAQQQYRAALLREGVADVRAAVLDDLSAHFGLTPDECLRRCVDWEAWSVQEWQARDRSSPEALAAFYHSVQSWAFDLLWYAYLQAEGHAYPVAVAAAESLPPPAAGARHLDFGSGTGITSQLFQRLGYESDLADISTSLLAFAAFRFARRGLSARQIDLNLATPEPGRYDVITAIDTLVHVPDVGETARMLHRALRPGGVLFANFDVRPATAENAWHLYSDDLPLRWALQRAGFEPEESLDGMIRRYRRVESSGPTHLLRGARDTVLLRSPLRPAYRRARAIAGRLRAARTTTVNEAAGDAAGKRSVAGAAGDDAGKPTVRRVLLVLQTAKVGGMETHCLDLAAEYVRSGLSVAVVLPVWREFDALAEAFGERGARVLRLATDARDGRASQLGGLLRLQRLLRAWRPQAVHLHTGGATGGAAVVALARAAGATTVITEHDVPAEHAPRKVRLARRAVDGLAHAVVAVSNRNADVRAERLGRRPQRGAIVLNGVPLPEPAADARRAGRERVRAALGIAPETVLIGCVVRLAAGKGLDTLLRAFALVRAQTPCRLLLVGDGPLRSELEALAAELGVHDAVIFAGQQADPAPWYDALDVFALAVPAGSMSIALLEALARGLPSVITFWNPDEALVPEVTGLAAPPNDPPALAAALTRLATDAELRRRLGTNAAAYVAERYSVSRVAGDLLALYGAGRSGVPAALAPAIAR